MIKRMVATFVLIASLFLFTGHTTVSASGNNGLNQPLTPPETMEGTLTSDTGEVMTVVGTLVENDQTFSSFSQLNSDSESDSATYEYSVFSTGTGSLSVSQTDGAVAVRVRLTIHYTETTSGLREARLDMVSGSWTRIDPTVAVTGRTLNYGSTSYTPTPIEQFGQVNNVPANFAYITGFDRLVGQLEGDVGARLSLTISRGTGSYIFIVNNYLFRSV